MKRVFLFLCILCLAAVCAGCHGNTPSHAETDTSGSMATSPVADNERHPHDTLPESTEEAPETKPEVVLPFTPATSELPIISINTNGVILESDENRSKEYVDMTLTLTNTADPLIDVHGSIRLRGNSTYDFVKKPYRIKFDQKYSLFGLEKAKSWVLLADYLDPSTLHNYAALTLAGTSEYLDFVPTPHKVNLYFNGEYAGIYTLCEQVQEQS